MHRLRRARRTVLLLTAATAVSALVVWSGCSREGNNDRLTATSTPDATPRAEANENRTDAHSAPHIDLPAGVFVFTDGSAVYTVHPDGTGLLRVGTAAQFTRPVLVRGGSRVNFEPAVPSGFVPQQRLSPDGWRLATFDEDGVHIANADGSDSRLVSSEVTQSPPTSSIAWVGDNRHLFVWGGQRIGSGGFQSGAVFDVDSGSRELLPRETNFPFAISPSGDHIAYTRRSGGLTVALPDGSDPVDVNGGVEVAQYDLWHIAWSPAGDRLVFPIAGAGSGFAIAAADGSRTIRFPALPAAKSGLASLVWSPDGRYVAASGDQDPIEHYRVLVFDTRNVDAPPIGIDAGLVDSSSGVRIMWWDDGLGVFFVGRGAYAGEGVGHLGLYSVSLDGKSDIRLSGDLGVAQMVGMTH